MSKTATERGSSLYQLVLLVLSVYVLGALVVEAFLIEDPEVRSVLQYIDFGICIVFLFDFFINLATAPSKKEYLKWGWIDFISSIPVIDPLRWGRVSRVLRIFRYFRAMKSMRILIDNIRSSKLETLSWSVFLIVFTSFTLSAALILEYERGYDSSINTAEQALWWAFLNIMNAKTSIDQALSAEGIVITTVLNKVGVLLFAYLNSMIIAWLITQKTSVNRNTDEAAIGDGE